MVSLLEFSKRGCFLITLLSSSLLFSVSRLNNHGITWFHPKQTSLYIYYTFSTPDDWTRSALGRTCHKIFTRTRFYKNPIKTLSRILEKPRRKLFDLFRQFAWAFSNITQEIHLPLFLSWWPCLTFFTPLLYLYFDNIYPGWQFLLRSLITLLNFCVFLVANTSFSVYRYGSTLFCRASKGFQTSFSCNNKRMHNTYLIIGLKKYVIKREWFEMNSGELVKFSAKGKGYSTGLPYWGFNRPDH